MITERSVCGRDGDELCRVGMVGPGGGVVFFVDHLDQFPSFCASDDCNYLEAAPEDASTGVAWCSETGDVLGLAGWDRSAVGAGRTNTAFMLAGSPARCSSGAAVVANAYFTDQAPAGEWWLPSIGELLVMYTNLRPAGAGDFTPVDYWSSSEDGAATTPSVAWRQSFSTGTQFTTSKASLLRVRPVRAF